MAYDADGKRVKSEDSSGTTKFIWDRENILVETNAIDITQTVYTLEPIGYGNLVSQYRAAVTSFFQFDGLGSTNCLTDGLGAVSDIYVYKAFGELVSVSETVINPQKFLGKLGYFYDTDLQEYYIRARHYVPRYGLFLSRDPLAGREFLEPYQYAGHRPTNTVDPSGLEITPRPGPTPIRPRDPGLKSCCCQKVSKPRLIYIALDCPVLNPRCNIVECFAAPKCIGRSTCGPRFEGSWKERCDPSTSGRGSNFAPALPPPPQSPPNPGEPCSYPNRLVCVAIVGQCWQSQCVCQCVGDSPGLNCIRGCIQCSHDSGAPINIDAEEMCRAKCPQLTANEQARLACCLTRDWNQGGCNIPWFLLPSAAGMMDPLPTSPCLTMPVP
jgi:RHS repeat-associated protein